MQGFNFKANVSKDWNCISHKPICFILFVPTESNFIFLVLNHHQLMFQLLTELGVPI